MNNEWYGVHDESLGSASVTMTVWESRLWDQPAPRILFEVNRDGLEIRYYQTAKDAVLGEHAIAVSCYGEVTILTEEGRFNEWLDRVWDEQDSTEITVCGHEGKTCDEVFDEAQKVLGNA
jgi:hypothetical protein